jgi:hypothetical protein
MLWTYRCKWVSFLEKTFEIPYKEKLNQWEQEILYWEAMWERWNTQKKLVKEGKDLPKVNDPWAERMKEAMRYDPRWDYRDHECKHQCGSYMRYKSPDTPRGHLYFPAPINLNWFHVRERKESFYSEVSSPE